jgi:hypothetical protein
MSGTLSRTPVAINSLRARSDSPVTSVMSNLESDRHSAAVTSTFRSVTVS